MCLHFICVQLRFLSGLVELELMHFLELDDQPQLTALRSLTVRIADYALTSCDGERSRSAPSTTSAILCWRPRKFLTHNANHIVTSKVESCKKDGTPLSICVCQRFSFIVTTP